MIIIFKMLFNSGLSNIIPQRAQRNYYNNMKNPKDWKKYNKKLVKRGMILLDPAIIPNFYKDVKKRGRPYRYTN